MVVAAVIEALARMESVGTGGGLKLFCQGLGPQYSDIANASRQIKDKEIKIEDVWEQYRLISTTTLRPEAIPLNIKIILVGNPYLYYLLYTCTSKTIIMI